MAADHTTWLRQAVVDKLRNSEGVCGYVNPENIFGERAPTSHGWPFIRYGTPDMAAFDATGINGAEVNVTIHTYVQDVDTTIIGLINREVTAALHDAQLELDDGWCLDVSFVRSAILSDGTTGFHGVLTFSALTGQEA